MVSGSNFEYLERVVERGAVLNTNITIPVSGHLARLEGGEENMRKRTRATTPTFCGALDPLSSMRRIERL